MKLIDRKQAMQAVDSGGLLAPTLFVLGVYAAFLIVGVLIGRALCGC